MLAGRRACAPYGIPVDLYFPCLPHSSVFASGSVGAAGPAARKIFVPLRKKKNPAQRTGSLFRLVTDDS